MRHDDLDRIAARHGKTSREFNRATYYHAHRACVAQARELRASLGDRALTPAARRLVEKEYWAFLGYARNARHAYQRT